MEDRKRSKNVALIAKALDWYTNNKVRIYVAGFFCLQFKVTVNVLKLLVIIDLFT
jgi:hypothetical protein